jgi:hypothetical protein
MCRHGAARIGDRHHVARGIDLSHVPADKLEFSSQDRSNFPGAGH